MPAVELNAIDVNGLQVIEAAERTNVFRSVTGPLRQALEIESDLRYEFSKRNANYEEIERIAVLTADASHYEDGIEAATTGDTGDRLGWIGEMHELFADMLEYATSVIDRAPTTSTTLEKAVYDAGGGAATPSSLSDQILGASGR